MTDGCVVNINKDWGAVHYYTLQKKGKSERCAKVLKILHLQLLDTSQYRARQGMMQSDQIHKHTHLYKPTFYNLEGRYTKCFFFVVNCPRSSKNHFHFQVMAAFTTEPCTCA